MSNSLYRRLRTLVAGDPLRVGTVSSTHPDGTVTLALAEGGSLRVRAPPEIQGGMRVFAQDGAVLGAAPELPFVEIEV